MQKLDGSRGWRRADGGPSSLVALAAAYAAALGGLAYLAARLRRKR